MENRPFDPELPDEESTEVTPTKRRGGSFLSQFLKQRREQEQAVDQETDDDDEELEEKPKRFRKLLSKIFPKVVEKPERGSTKSDSKLSLESWLGGNPAKIDEAITDDDTEKLPGLASELPELSISHPVELSEYTPVDQIESIDDDEEDDLEANTTATSTALPVPSTGKARFKTASGQPLLPPAGPPPLPNLPGSPNMVPPPSAGPNGLPSTPNVPMGNPNRMVPQSEQVTVERERVIERRGSALPYLVIGAEYFARKSADKKLQKKVTEKISNTQAEVTRNAILQQELNTVVKQNREQLDALKQNRASQEQAEPRTPEVAPTILKPESKTPEPPKSFETAIPQEKQRISQLERQDNPENVQRKIFEQVADAAENDVPVERVFERSHEVKDDKTVPVGAASVGSVVAAIHPVVSTPAIVLPSSVYTKESSGQLAQRHQSDSDTYRQAMKAGFWTATMIIILGSFAYLMLK